MQAPLSSTASGKVFNRRSVHAVLNASASGQTGKFVVPPPRPARKTEAWKGAPGGADPTVTSVAEGVGLAHDAGNLLGALGLYSQLLARPGVLREEHRHYADELQMLSGRSRELIDRLLDPATNQGILRSGLSPHAAHASSPVTQAEGSIGVAVPDVIERCRGLLNAIAGRVVAVTYGAGAEVPVAVSEETLERIVVNLTKNAAEATKGEGTIFLRVTCRPATSGGDEAVQPKRIVLTVADEGLGMSAAVMKRLLESRGTDQPAGPHGIGFRVVRELAGATGGQLRLQSRSEGEERGTTVEVAWPIAMREAWMPLNLPVDAPQCLSMADPECSARYIPTARSERHGLLRMAGPMTAAEPSEHGTKAAFGSHRAALNAPGRTIC